MWPKQHLVGREGGLFKKVTVKCQHLVRVVRRREGWALWVLRSSEWTTWGLWNDISAKATFYTGRGRVEVGLKDYLSDMRRPPLVRMKA